MENELKMPVETPKNRPVPEAELKALLEMLKNRPVPGAAW
jgi:hypothetical protein